MAHDNRTAEDGRLIIPALGGLYCTLTPVARTLLRVIAGGMLALHGWPKINNPFGAVGMVESLGFYPGTIWAPLLACTEFFGGLLIMLGLLTRPAAIAGTIVLLVTVYFHWIVKAEGLAGAEKSVLWAAILFFFAITGGGRWSLDRKIGKWF